MRVVMITHSYYLRDPRVRREAEALAEAGYTVDVICLRDQGEPHRSEVNGVHIYRVPLRRRRGGFLRYLFEYLAFFVLSGLLLSALQLRRRYRLVHVHNMPNFLVFATLLPRLFGAKVILDMHDPMPELFQSQFKLAPRHWIVRLLRLEESLSCRYPHYLITVNEPMRRRLLNNRLNPERVQVVLNLPDPKIFSSCQDQLGSLKANNNFTLVYTGTISQRYGLDIAIEALRILRLEMPDLRLVIVGEGPHLPELQQKTKAYGLKECVLFRNKVPLERVPELLAQCDVGISPHGNDVFWELYFSTKIVEFLSMGLPVISSRTRTIEHYFDDSMLFFFEPGNVQDFVRQVRIIRGNPDLVRAKRAAAQAKLRELNWEMEKQKFLRLVGQIVGLQKAAVTEANPSQIGGHR
jgi:glycosyltransferase involved in cell wall biosynthesis